MTPENVHRLGEAVTKLYECCETVESILEDTPQGTEVDHLELMLYSLRRVYDEAYCIHLHTQGVK